MSSRRLAVGSFAILLAAGCGDVVRANGAEDTGETSGTGESGESGETDPGQCPDTGSLTVLHDSPNPLGPAIVVDGDTVYFGDDEALLAMSASGGEVVELAANAPRSIAVRDGVVFWTSAIGVHRVDTDGKNADNLSFVERVGALVVDGDWVYFATWSPNQLWRVPVDGGQPQLVAASTADGPTPGLAGDADALYWVGLDNIEPGPLIRYDVGAGSGIELAHPASVVRGLAADGDSVYWSEASGGDLGVGNLDVTDADGNTEVFAEGQGLPYGIALDPERVFWTDNVLDGSGAYAGHLRCRPKAGGDVVTVVEYEGLATDLAVTGDAAYWVSNPMGGGGSLTMLAW